MSPRAACRLETREFGQVHDYVGGKADWLANGLPREGERATVAYAGELVDREPPTCALADIIADVRAVLAGAPVRLLPRAQRAPRRAGPGAPQHDRRR